MWTTAVLLVIPAKKAVRKSKRCHSGARALAREPGNHEHRSPKRLAKHVFIGSGPGPAGRPGTTTWYFDQFPNPKDQPTPIFQDSPIPYPPGEVRAAAASTPASAGVTTKGGTKPISSKPRKRGPKAAVAAWGLASRFLGRRFERLRN